MSSGNANVPDSIVPPLPAQSSIHPTSIAGMDGVVGLEPVETGKNTKECGALSEWEQPGDNSSLHRRASIVSGDGGGGKVVPPSWSVDAPAPQTGGVALLATPPF